MDGLTNRKQNYTWRVAVPYGDTFPLEPLMGELFYRSDLKALFIFIGVGETGTTSGWFNLKQAVYAP